MISSLGSSRSRGRASQNAARGLGLCLLLPLAACAEQQVWTGARCPRSQVVCREDESDVGTPRPEAGLDATLALSDASTDAGDASSDACTDCAQGPEEEQSKYCPAGRYEGPQLGHYTPGAAGACGLFNLFGDDGKGLFRFSVGKRNGAQSAPVASSGCDVGWIDNRDGGLAPSGPPDDAAAEAGSTESRGLLTGSVDCTTGELSAEMRGTYHAASLCTLGFVEDDYFFKGTISAVFDPKTQTFVGNAVLSEPPSALGPAPGGSGTFSATRIGASDVLDDASTNCFGGLTFPEHLFADAGR